MPRPSRRDFLRVGTLGVLGLTEFSALAQAVESTSSSPARNVILVWLNGGPSTIDMWDLKPNATSQVRGEFNPISTSADGIEICEHLPKMAQQMHECTLIRSVAHTIAEHGQGTEYVTTGNPISPALKYPSIGSVVASKTEASQDVPAYIEMSEDGVGQSGYLGSTYSPFLVDPVPNRRRPTEVRDQFALPEGTTTADLTRKSQLLEKLEVEFERFGQQPRATAMQTFQHQAVNILSGGKTREALNLSQEDDKTRARYGFGLGRRALAALRLIERGARFVTIGLGGWDTHSNNFTELRNNLLPQLDSALSSLIADLRTRGLLDETIVYCVGEFNRTPKVNAQGGRDHWARSMSVLLAGGGIQNGFVYGSTDRSGSEPMTDACSPADVNATILNQLGVPPETLLTTNSGRPMQVFRDANVLSRIVAKPATSQL